MWRYVLDKSMTQDIYIKVVYPWILQCVPDHFKMQEMCNVPVLKDPRFIIYYLLTSATMITQMDYNKMQSTLVKVVWYSLKSKWKFEISLYTKPILKINEMKKHGQNQKKRLCTYDKTSSFNVCLANSTRALLCSVHILISSFEKFNFSFSSCEIPTNHFLKFCKNIPKHAH